MPAVSVVIPVKDGARHLGEVLAAVLAEGPSEVLVIDSGSSDGSVQIARDAGVRVLEIAPEEFGHGRTRNLGASATSGDVIAYLTQDATPLPGWLEALVAGFELHERVGAVYGPHLPREDTSPMIARELEEFFALHSPDGGPVLQWEGDRAFLSNVNAAYRRDCWEQIRFDDVQYAEDQAFAGAMLAAGWAKVYAPDARVLHAHDYPPADFMRRYFDEYRGLRRTIGHVERIGVRSTVRHVRGSVAQDRDWMRRRGWDARRRARWTARSVVHHGGRKVFSALGSHSDSLPEGVQRRLSLEGTVAPRPAPVPQAAPVPAAGPSPYSAVLRVAREGPAPLLEPLPGLAERDSLHVAVVIPPFRRGSGGHNSIFQMLSRLERMGHNVSVWLDDPLGWQASEWPAVVRRNINEYFAPFRGPVLKGFDSWYGADVAVATGWQTVHPVLALDQVRARAYVVHDHEPEFYASSAEAVWAAETYRFGMHAICASPWLGDIVRRYGGSVSLFDFGVDHEVYRPRPVQRRRDTVIFYGRDVTPRRAVPLGVLALEELRARRPDLRIVIFGDDRPAKTPFPHEHLGIASPDQLAQAYSEATVGLVLSLTNYSLIPQEMLACGLPCVDLAGFSAETVFGIDGPVELAPPDPVQLADAVERLLDEPERWERRSAAGREFVADRTWDRSASQLDAGLREAIRRREHEAWEDRRSEGEVYASGASLGQGLDARAVPVAWEPESRLCTTRLLDRLSSADLGAIEDALTDDEREERDRAPSAVRPRMTLSLGVWHRVPAVLEKTGLVPDEPPEAIHAMARGPWAAGGGLYEADLVAEVMSRAGRDVASAGAALDYGCSSGRVLRPLAAAWPEVDWHGCDPNAQAIEWARAHVPGVSFQASPTDPPLPYGDGTFRLVYAISIWSHHAEAAAIRWLEEMARVLRPGGLLVLTAHGYTTVAQDSGKRSPRELEQIRRALYRRGFWFAPEFGDAGDFGVAHPEWGTAFFTPEWLLRTVAGAWTVEHFGPGQNARNQDVYVLRRR